MSPLTFNLSLPTHHTILHLPTNTPHDEESTSTTPPSPTTLTTSPSPSSSPPLPTGARVFLATVLLLAAGVGVGGNGVMCVLVYRKPSMQSSLNLLVAQLALSDLLLSALILPFAGLGLLLSPGGGWRWQEEVCALGVFLHDVLVTLNTCLLLSITVDRYLIVVHRQEKLLSVYRARVLILLAWGFALTSASCPLLGWGQRGLYPGHPLCWDTVARGGGASDLSYVLFRCVVCRYLPLTAIVYAYVCMVRVVRRKGVRVAHSPLTLGVTDSSGSALALRPQPRVSVTCALRDLSSSQPGSGVGALTSSAATVGCGHLTAECGQAMMEYGQENASVSFSLSSLSPVRFLTVNNAVGHDSNKNQNHNHHHDPTASSYTSHVPDTMLDQHLSGKPSPSNLTASSEDVFKNHFETAAVSTSDNVHTDLRLNSPIAATTCRPTPNTPSQHSCMFLASSNTAAVTTASDAASADTTTTTAASATPRPSALCSCGLPHAPDLTSSLNRHRTLADVKNLKTRTFKTILLLSLVLVTCLVPYATAGVVSSWEGHCPCRVTLCLLLWLELVKSAVNPLVYGLRIRKFREACRDLCPGGVWRLCARCVEVLASRRVDPSSVYRCAEHRGS